MKCFSLIRIGFLAGLVCLVISNGSAQKRLVESKSLSDALSRAGERTSEKQKNVESITEEYADGTVILRTIASSQFVSSDRYRSYLKTERLGKGTEKEVIRIGDVIYTRENDGPWIKEFRSPFAGLELCCGLQSPSRIVSQVSVESVFLGNFQSDLYERLTIKEGKSGLEMIESRYWIGLEGFLLQEEEVEGTFSPRVVKNRRLVKYDYEPNIKIEAPIK
jgi:hypothetical protein